MWIYCFIDCLAVGGARLLIRNGGILDSYFNDRHESAAEGLSIELLIPADSDIRLDDLLESQLCLQVNGYKCYCFPSSYRDVKVTTVPRQCLPKHKNWTILWFSVQLRFDAVYDPSQNEALIDVQENSPNTRTINSLAALVRNEHHPRVNHTHCTAPDGHKVNKGPALLSLVLPLAMDDLSRSLILLNSLKLVPTDTVLELLIFVPNDHLPLLKKPIDGMMANGFNFSTSVYSEQVLFRRPFAEYTNTAYPYALQMAIKLLAAQLVTTPFYITLDADVMLLHPFSTDMLLSEHTQDVSFTSFTFDDSGIHSHPPTIGSSNCANHYRAAYHYEDRNVHPNWWSGSETLLGVGPSQEVVGFGVTPALLSTFGSLSTVAMICSSLEEYATEFDGVGLQSTAACEERWLDGLGVSGSRSGLWSEYTAYRLALQDLEVSSFAAIAHDSSASLHTTPICSCSICCTLTRYRWASSCIATTSGTLISCHGPLKKHYPTRAAYSR